MFWIRFDGLAGVVFPSWVDIAFQKQSKSLGNPEKPLPSCKPVFDASRKKYAPAAGDSTVPQSEKTPSMTMADGPTKVFALTTTPGMVTGAMVTSAIMSIRIVAHIAFFICLRRLMSSSEKPLWNTALHLTDLHANKNQIKRDCLTGWTCCNHRNRIRARFQA